jgi:hypothetical protein
MTPNLTALRPPGGSPPSDYLAEETYGFHEVTPEEEAARCVNAIWESYATEMASALRKMSENA